MGGMLSFRIAALGGDKVAAAAPYYGAPLGDEPDWSGLRASILGHFAESDDYFPPDAVLDLGERLRKSGKDVTIHVYPGTGHAFANEEDVLGTYNETAAKQAWTRTIEFLKNHLN
jgi:carboxymethylenebutenolidase